MLPLVPPDDAPATPRFALGLALCFALLCAAGLWRHEMWLDEAQAWLIAARATSLSELFARMTYEGHPPLWHLLLYAVSRFFPNPVAMQVLSGLFATAAVFLVAWRSPMSRLQKTLFALGYYPLFEFGVISRGYGLGLCCLAALVAVWHGGERRPLVLIVPLLLLTQTSAYGLILAWALALWLAVEWLDPPAVPDGREAAPTQAVVGAVLVLVGATGGALWFMRAPADATFHVHLASWLDGSRGAWTVYAPFHGFMPLPDPFSPFPWNSSPFSGRPFWGELAYGLGPVTLMLAAASFTGRAAAGLAFGVGTVVLLGFTYGFYAGSTRHHAHFFLLWLALVWVARPTGLRLTRWLSPWQASLGKTFPAALRIPLLAAVGLVFVGAVAQPLDPTSAPLLALVVPLTLLAAWLRWEPTGARLLAVVAAHAGGAPLTALLAMHAAAGGWLLVADLRQPFSAAEAMAVAIRSQSASLPVYVADTTQTNHLGPGLAMRLEREVRYVQRSQDFTGSYLVWDRARPPFVANPTPELRLGETQLGLFALGKRLPPGTTFLFASETVLPVTPPGLAVQVVATASLALTSDEPRGMALYRVTVDRQAGAACPLPPNDRRHAPSQHTATPR